MIQYIVSIETTKNTYDRTNASNSLVFQGDVWPRGSNSVILKEDEIIFIEIKDKLKLDHYLSKNIFFSKSGNVAIGSRNTRF